MPQAVDNYSPQGGFWLGTLSTLGQLDSWEDIGDRLRTIAYLTDEQLDYMAWYIATAIQAELEDRSPFQYDRPMETQPRYRSHLNESYYKQRDGSGYRVMTSEYLKFSFNVTGTRGHVIEPIPVEGSLYALTSQWTPNGLPRQALWWPGLPKPVKAVMHRGTAPNSFYDDAWNYVMSNYAPDLIERSMREAMNIFSDREYETPLGPPSIPAPRVAKSQAAQHDPESGRYGTGSPWYQKGYTTKYSATRGLKRAIARGEAAAQENTE